MPTSDSEFFGITGENQTIQGGIDAVHEIEFASRTNFEIQNEHGGVASNYRFEVSNLPTFESNSASFEVNFGSEFDTGPNYGSDAVFFNTRAVNLRAALLNSSDTTADITVDLPTVLTVDKDWDNTRIYFAGSGIPGALGYYPGQRCDMRG